MFIPDVVAYSRQRELRTIEALLRGPILVSDGTGTPIRTPQTVQTDHVESRGIKGLTGTTQQRTPPVGHIGTTTQRMANHQRVVGLGRQLTPRRVGDGDIVQGHARFEGEGRNHHKLLIGDELRIGIFRLRVDSLYGI